MILTGNKIHPKHPYFPIDINHLSLGMRSLLAWPGHSILHFANRKMPRKIKITFYGYNCFVIESGKKKIVIDPGGSFYLPDFFKSIIPKSEWQSITHIFVTHGDPDHHWYTDRIAAVSGAKVICNEKMVRIVNGKKRMLGPRKKGLAFTASIDKLHTIAVDESIDIDGMQITGIKGTHGPLTLNIGPFSKTLHEGPEERFGFGEMGFRIVLQGRTIINLGDTILHENEWENIKHPDVLMIPIGGKIPGNTMDEVDALKAVKVTNPKLVIPTHYNCAALFSKCYNPADEVMFKEEVVKMGIKCIVLHIGDSIDLMT